MALHPVKLPKSAALLFRVVALQKKLLKALADPQLNSNSVDIAWVQNVWSMLDAEWVRKFCRGGKESVLHPLKAIAAASSAARQALYDEFCQQNKVQKLLNAGGNFHCIVVLRDFDAALAEHVKNFFSRCYNLLSNRAQSKWTGYEFGGNRTLSNRAYKDDFCSEFPTKVVCPYCDGEIGTPELDHYFGRSDFPLLACSPWNLTPVCKSCNDAVTGKGSGLAITLGPPRSTADWLHPFFRPASAQVQIKLSGQPKDSIPQLHSQDAAEQKCLDNHTVLIRSLSERWTNIAAAHFDRLVCQVKKKMKTNQALTISNIIRENLDEELDSHGKSGSSMIRAAVCQAILDQRPEYLNEFTNSNAPVLA